MLEVIFYFSFGFIVAYALTLYYYHRNDIPYLLTTMKEDVQSLHVSMSHVLEKLK